MRPEDLWAILGVQEGGWHRFTWPADWSGVTGLNVFGERVPWKGDRWGEMWVPVADRDRFVFYAGLEDVQVSMVPRLAPNMDAGLAAAGVMWARLDSGKQMLALERFRPVPSVVFREGSSVRRLAVWFVFPHPNVMQLERGNRRLAQALGARPKFAGAEQAFHPPGVVLRWGRDRRPLEVAVESWSGKHYTPGMVAGHLRDAPAPWQPDRAAA